LEDRVLPAISLVSHYQGIDFVQSGQWVPPDMVGAAGPSCYVETTQQAVAIYTPKASGTTVVMDSLTDGQGGSDFWYTRGGLTSTNPKSFTLFNPTMVWDDQIQRFIVGEQDADFANHIQKFNLAVSKTASPTTLTAADWNFYQIDTTESGFDAEGFGNMGYNHDAFVFTLRAFVGPGQPPDHILVTSVKASDLLAGGPLTVFHNDVATHQPLRPATMHNSQAGDPMWLVGEHNPIANAGQSIDVFKMTNVLSNSATIVLTTLAVNPYTDTSKTPPLQPDGTVITPFVNSSILKAAEADNTLVATHAISVSATEDDARWYAIDVSTGTPVLRDQGNVSAGDNNYIICPGIDINPAGSIGMSYIQSGTLARQFMSVYATGRNSSDPAGTMETPVLVQAGVQNYHDFNSALGAPQRAGDFSGISIDADGSFWIVNEFADNEPVNQFSADWGTAIGNFTVPSGGILPTDLALNVSGSASGVEDGPLTYNVTITNKGPVQGVNVSLSDPLPADTSFVSASFTQGTFAVVNGVFTLTIPTLDSQATITGTITLAPLEERPITNTLTLAGANPDTDTTNDQGSVTTTVTDAAVVLTLPAVSGQEGQSGDLVVATFADPGGPEVIGDYSASIDWGDGQTSAGTITLDPSTGIFSVHGTHGYAEEGTTTRTVTVHHDTAPDAQLSGTAQIADPAVSATGAFVLQLTEGMDTGTQTIATFTDPGGAEALADYTANINWGDGQTSTGTITFATGVFTVTGSHRYSEESSGYTIAVTIGHDTAASSKATSSAVVSDPAVVAAGAAGVAGSEGASTGGTVATFTDPAGAEALSEYRATIVWETGQTSTGTISLSGNVFTVTGSHAYQSEGTVPFTVTIHHALAGDVTVTGSVNVSDPAVVATGGFSATFTEGSPSASVPIATFADPAGAESLADYSATIDWGGGSTSAGVISLANGRFTVSGSHNYLEQGTSDFTVTIHHDTATDVAVTDRAVIMDAPLSLAAKLFKPVEGAAFSGPVATLVDANSNATIDDFSATIQWGDGTSSVGTVMPNANGGFDVAGGHTYAQAGTQQVTVSVNDTGGASRTLTSQVNVEDAALSAFSVATIPSVEGAGLNALVAKFNDANPGGRAADFTAAIDWGDGATSPGTITADPGGGFDVTASHTYHQEGAYMPFVTVLDRGGSTASAISTVSVADAVLSAAGVTLHTVEGGADGGINGVVATFHDANPFASAGEFGGSIDWGDGSSTTTVTIAGGGGDYQLVASHRYAHVGSFSVSVMILDPGGSTAQATTMVTVGEVALQGIPLTFGSKALSYSGEVARFVDPGNDPSQTYTASINWGDGTTTTAGVTGVPGNMLSVVGSHAFALPGNMTVTVTVSEPGNSPIAVTSTALIGTGNERWLAQVYHDLLQRTIDPSGLAYWESLLDQGVSRTTVIAGIQSSPEYRSKLVQGWYLTFLGRQADPQGLAGYVQFLTDVTGIGGDNRENFVKQQILSSAEYFFNRGGGTNDGFLHALSHELLGHDFDANTAATLSLMLAQGTSRLQIVTSVLNSLSVQQAIVANDYLRLLHRPVDPTGMQSGVGALQQGFDEDFVIANLISSDEYFRNLIIPP
jgi:uncharacterized repeat protein (TIGR01451 family)